MPENESQNQDDCRMAELVDSLDGNNAVRYAKTGAKSPRVLRRILFVTIPIIVIAGVVAVLPPLERCSFSARKVCVHPLKRIGNSMHTYADDCDNQFPPDLETLVSFGVSPASMLSPISGNNQYYCDYAYVSGLTVNSPPDWIVAYGDPNWAEDNPGANILFVDGHVKFFGPSEFKQTLQKFFDAYAELHGEYPKIIPPHDTTKEFWESRGVSIPDWDDER